MKAKIKQRFPIRADPVLAKVKSQTLTHIPYTRVACPSAYQNTSTHYALSKLTFRLAQPSLLLRPTKVHGLPCRQSQSSLTNSRFLSLDRQTQKDQDWPASRLHY